ncbi:ABC transporter permease [Clostridium perfringens]|uniref:ABC transporter permease n=1 Tax=Clostridium perfringens TaxID=1502 RepID=UPI0030CBCBEB
MRKLITANFHRFSKDRFSWCVLGIVVILSLGNVFNSVGSFETMAASGYAVSLDEYYFNQAPLIGAFLALLISMFLGTEFSEGTIRNKLCIGHKRNEIFLSNFISCALATIVLTAVWLLTSALLFGMIGPLEIEMEVSEFVGCIFVAVGFTVSFAALYTVIGSLSSNKAMTIIYTFAVFIVLVMAASALDDRLCEPEMHTGMTIVGNQFVEMEPTPNPLYLSGATRTVCEVALELLPTGQALLLSDVAIEYPVRAIALSVVFTVVTLLVGSMLFRRKDIK